MRYHSLAPVVLFAYKRLGTLQQTVSSLQQNYLAKETDLFVFSDGAKSAADEPVIARVRHYLRTVRGFNNIQIVEARDNTGLASSVINGVTNVINNEGKVIVLEDDLITSRNFLMYMNQGLDYYENNPKVFSISGFSFIINGLRGTDVYFTQRASSWSWATWADRWKDVDWEVKDYSTFRKDIRQRWLFNKMGSDMSGMLDRQMKGKIDSWAIRWCFHQFKKQLYTVYPSVSKVSNIGFTQEASNTRDVPGRYATIMDDSTISDFNFTDEVQLAPQIIKQFTKHYSLSRRARYKIINAFYNLLAKQ